MASSGDLRAAVFDGVSPVFAGELPAVVSFESDWVSTGRAALRRALDHPEALNRGIKRRLGEAPAAGNVRSDILGAYLIQSIADLAERRYPRAERAVVTAPAWLSEAGRLGLTEAFRGAGIAVDALIDEASATALAFQYGREGDELVAVVDAGAGGVIASILQLRPDLIMTLASAHDGQFGGDEVDQALVGQVLSMMGDEVSPGDLRIREHLVQTLEPMK